MLEKDFQKKVIAHHKKYYYQDYILLKVILCNLNGFPDLTFLSGSRTFCIELKKKGEKARELQNFRARELRKRGVETYVVDDFDQILEILPKKQS